MFYLHFTALSHNPPGTATRQNNPQRGRNTKQLNFYHKGTQCCTGTSVKYWNLPYSVPQPYRNSTLVLAAPRTINEAGLGAGPYRPYRGPQYYADSKLVDKVRIQEKKMFLPNLMTAHVGMIVLRLNDVFLKHLMVFKSERTQTDMLLFRACLCITPQYSCTVRIPWLWRQIIQP